MTSHGPQATQVDRVSIQSLLPAQRHKPEPVRQLRSDPGSPPRRLRMTGLRCRWSPQQTAGNRPGVNGAGGDAAAAAS